MEETDQKTPGNCYILFIGVVYISYILLGAAIFMAIELPQGSHSIRGVDDDNLPVKIVKELFVRNHSCVSEHDLEQLIQTVHEAVLKNVDPRGNTTPSHDWNAFSSVIFSTSVVTTIGFGNVTPKTALGQIVCIAYASIGIPLNFTLLGYLGTKLQSTYIKIAEKLSRKRHRRKRIRCVVGILLGSTLSILLPALVYRWVEGWSYLESVYFSFITISTIGFGDFYPSLPEQRKHHTNGYYFIFAASIFWGMAWISTVFTIVQTRICIFNKSSWRKHREGSRWNRIRCCCGTPVPESNDPLDDSVNVVNSPQDGESPNALIASEHVSAVKTDDDVQEVFEMAQENS